MRAWVHACLLACLLACSLARLLACSASSACSANLRESYLAFVPSSQVNLCITHLLCCEVFCLVCLDSCFVLLTLDLFHLSRKDSQTTSTTTAAVALEVEAQPWMPATLIELESATDRPSNPQDPPKLPLTLSNWMCIMAAHGAHIMKLYVIHRYTVYVSLLVCSGGASCSWHMLASRLDLPAIVCGCKELDKPDLG